MSAIQTPQPFQRLFSGPIEVDFVFASTIDRNTYLGNLSRYAGQICFDSEQQKLYYLNNARDAWIEVGGASAGAGATTVPIISNRLVGSIIEGQTIPEGTTLQSFISLLLTTINNPTITPPSLSVSNNSANKEIGEPYNLAITATFNRGMIQGVKVNNVWNPSALQNLRAGAATMFTFDNPPTVNGGVPIQNGAGTATSNGATNTYTINGFVAPINPIVNEFVNVDYLQGPQPLNSEGQNFQTPLTAGSISANHTIAAGIRARFSQIGAHTTPVDNHGVRSLTKDLVHNSKVFNFGSPLSVFKATVAYPAIYGTGSFKYTVRLGTQTIEDGVSFRVIPVVDASGNNPIDYNVYTFELDPSFALNQDGSTPLNFRFD